jgi:alkylated DNA repair dioxygenase AlkB
MAAPISQLLFLPPELPTGLTYLADFVRPAEAVAVAQQIDALPWRGDLKRRVQHYGYRYNYKARQARREDYLGPLPDFLQALAQRLRDEGHFVGVPDQVIVNEYMAGQGISAHVDCQPCFGEVIASLSLLAPCIMRMQHQRTGQVADLWLEPASLLILSGPARHDWTHAIPARQSDVVGGQKHPRRRRVSLTFREMRFEKG